MANLLYLVHRLPYPPNKGDKVRSFNLLKHLARKHRVHLGTFIDDPDDAMSNGVDAEFFSPDHVLASPYRDVEVPVVFTGAMAMARPVVASAACAGAIDAAQGSELLAAADADEFVARIAALLGDRARAEKMGSEARQRVLASYSWEAHLARIDAYLEPKVTA